MHASAMKCGTVFFQCYGVDGVRILDVGSMDVNGSLRHRAPAGSTYVGMDLEPGKSVDVVVAPGAAFPFEDGSFDLVVSTSCFEHDAAFWETIIEVARILRPGGYFYLNAPSNGLYHSYPHDNWRFYPDAGLALAGWTERQGRPLALIESGTLPQGAEDWNDFYAVFRRGPMAQPPAFISDHFTEATNLRRLGSPVSHFAQYPEDKRARRENEEKLRLQTAALRQLTEQNAALEGRAAARELELAQARAQADAAGALLAQTGARLDEFLASRSWRLTAPLRWIADTLRRNF